MKVLALDAALDGCSAGLVVDGDLVASRFGSGGRGQAAVLPLLVREVLCGHAPASLDRVAVTVGPGSFTGIRAALALAQGIGLATGAGVAGVTVGQAFAAGAPVPDGWRLWVAIHARRDHVFLQTDHEVRLRRLDALPVPDGPLVVAGTAAPELLCRLARVSRWDCRLGPVAPDLAAIARAALSAPGPAEALYVDAPRTTGPGGPAGP